LFSLPNKAWVHGLVGYDVALTRQSNSDFSSIKVDENILQEYIQIRGLSGISERHIKEIYSISNKYLGFCEYCVNKKKTLNYLQYIKERCSVSRHRKQFYQIRKLLIFLNAGWLNNVEVPQEPQCSIKRIGTNKLRDTLDYFSSYDYFPQISSLILLGATSGLRAEELYQLKPDDIDLENRIVYVNHNPEIGQTTKTKKSRVSFFNRETQEALRTYVQHYTEYGFQYLFGKEHVQGIFNDYDIKVKHLRKFFSQEWDRRGGPTSIKKILMGHSLKGDVDLNHYNAQSEEDLKRIYDNVIPDYILLKP